MQSFETFFEYIVHIDKYLEPLVKQQPFWCYFVLGIIIFSETAFIVTAFLPSDVVLFSACSLMMVKNIFNPFILIPMFYLAAVAGDSVNFAIGRLLRKEVKKNGKVFFIKQENLEKTNKIFEKSGGTTVILARFVPLFRTLVPFVTGVSFESYKWFLKRNMIGVAFWTTVFCTLGVLFGRIKFVQTHFGLVVIGICFLTILTATISLTLRKLIFDKHIKK